MKGYPVRCFPAESVDKLQALLADLPPRPWKFDDYGEVIDATGKLVITATGVGGGDWFASFREEKFGSSLIAIVNMLDELVGAKP